MNINDFNPIPVTFRDMFRLQGELQFGFEPHTKERFENFDINTFDDQEFFKHFCWRITEELMEALEDPENEDHFREEVMDGFNFLLELYHFYGWGYDDMPSVKPFEYKKGFIPTEGLIFQIVYHLGLCANCLKNRQWRQSQHLVDLYVFEARFKKLWKIYMYLFQVMGMSEVDIRDLWSLKYQVNKFRLESNY